MKETIAKFIDHPVLKNNLFFSGGSYIFRLFNNLLMFSILARIFDVETFGLISLIITIIKILQTAIDYGHRMIVIRDVSSNSNILDREYVLGKLWLKVIIMLLFGIGTYYYAYNKDFWGYGSPIVLSIIVAGFITGLTNFYFAILQGLEKFKIETYSILSLSIFITIALVISFVHPTVHTFMVGYVLACLGQFAYTHYLTQKEIPGFNSFFDKIGIDFSRVKSELWIGLPFAAIVLVEILFTSYDSIFVEGNYTSLDLGYFEGFKKIYIGLNTVGIIFGTALYPVVSRISSKMSKANIFKLLQLTFGVTMLGLATFAFYFLFNSTIVKIILGEDFLVMTTWDFHLCILTVVSYMRAIPGAYFVSANKEHIRLWIKVIFFAIEIGAFYMILSESDDIREAIKLLTQINIWLTVAYLGVFSYIIYGQYNMFNKERSYE